MFEIRIEGAAILIRHESGVTVRLDFRHPKPPPRPITGQFAGIRLAVK